MESKLVLKGKSKDGKITFSVEIPAPNFNTEERAVVEAELSGIVMVFLHIMTGIGFMGKLAASGFGTLSNSLQNVGNLMQKQLDAEERKNPFDN